MPVPCRRPRDWAWHLVPPLTELNPCLAKRDVENAKELIKNLNSIHNHVTRFMSIVDNRVVGCLIRRPYWRLLGRGYGVYPGLGRHQGHT